MTTPENGAGQPLQPSRAGLGVLLGLAASLAFATSGTFVRPLFDAGWSPGAAVLWRVTCAAVLLLPVGLWVMRGRLRVVLAEWRVIVGFGALAVATAQLMYFAAVSRMSVSVALLIEYMAPVLLVLLAWARTRHAPSRLVIAGTLASVLGLVCVLDLTGARLDSLGVVFGFGAMIGAAAYFVLGARPTRLHPLALPAFGLPVGAVVLGLATLVGALPYSAPLVDVQVMGAMVPWWVPLGVVVLAATALAYALGVAGIGLMGERLSSFVSLSEVLFAALIAAAVLGEIPTPIQVLGGVLIVAGVVLIRFASGRAPVGLPTFAEELEVTPHARAQPAGDVDYEATGGGYASVRRPDGRIAALVDAALGEARTVVNVGAGAGSYEPRHRQVVAVEPSALMRAQRPAGAAPAVDAVAEDLPFGDDSFDAAMATVTIHQWKDWERGLRELRRVSRGPVVILTFDPEALPGWWLHDYVPQLFGAEAPRYPAIDAICAVLGGKAQVSAVPVPLDCTDGFVEAFYGRPEALLDPAVRAAQSAWRFADPDVVATGLDRLAADLASGEWDLRYGHLRTQPEFVGAVRLVVATR